MAKVRLVAPEAVIVPELGYGRRVEPDEIVTVPDDRVAGYTCQPQTWELVEDPAEPPAAKPRSRKD